jgi:hypothetical protein
MQSRLFYSLIISLLAHLSFAQDTQDKVWQRRWMLGADITKNLGGLLNNNYDLIHFEPILRYAKNIQSPIYALHLGYTRFNYPQPDSLAIDYANEGFYLKLGAEYPIITHPKKHLTIGLNVVASTFFEKATIRIPNNYFGAGSFPAQRKNAWNIGSEILLTYYHPLTNRIIITAQMRLGAFFNPNWNFADAPNEKLAFKTYYVQGMGLSTSNFTSVFSLQMFYKFGT